MAVALLSFPYVHPIQVAWCSRNAGAVASRTVNASLYNMFVQAGSIIGSNVYRADDSPRYVRGNTVCIIMAVVNLVVLYPGTKLYYVWGQKDRVRDAMSPEERPHYHQITMAVRNRGLDSRFAH